MLRFRRRNVSACLLVRSRCFNSMFQDLNITLGGSGQTSGGSTNSGAAARATPRIANPYLDASIARESGGVRQMEGRPPVGASTSDSAPGEQIHRPTPAPGASTKIQVGVNSLFSDSCRDFIWAKFSGRHSHDPPKRAPQYQTIRLLSDAHDQAAHTRHAQPPRILCQSDGEFAVENGGSQFIGGLHYPAHMLSLRGMKMTGSQAPREEFNSQTCTERAV